MRKLLVIASLFGGCAFAQGCIGYLHTYNVVIPTASVTATLTSLTVMVQGTYAGGGSGMDLRGTGSGGFATNANGYDIGFAKDGALLTWSMPRYVASTGEIRANVLMPGNLTTTAATVFQMCVGKSGITTFQGGSRPYDTNTKMALNFTSAALTADDTTLQTGTNHGATYSSSGPTHIGDAVALNGTNQYIDYGATPGFQTGNGARTLTWWGNIPSAVSLPIGFTYGINSAHNCFEFFINSSPFSWTAFDCTNSYSNSASGTALNVWHRYDGVYDIGSTTFRYYKDGVADGTGAIPVSESTTLSGSSLGSNLAHTANWYAGSIAALKFANVARSAQWIAAEYLNQNNPDPGFYTISSASSFSATPAIIPSNHGGNITLTLTGSLTNWVQGTTIFTPSGVTGVTKVSQNITSAIAATVVVTTGSTAGTLTITETVTGASTATLGVAVATLAINPTSGAANTTPTLTVTGGNTVWAQETAAGLFTVAGGTGASIGTPAITSNTAGTVTLTDGSAGGTLTITDTSTGATATFTVIVVPVLTSGPTCSANSPSSVACSWTTDVKSDSEVRCGTVSGGPYPYTSDVINPVDTVAVADFWGVTSHSMPSGGVPNGTVYCIVLSKSKTGGVFTSAEVATATGATAPTSRPMRVASIGAISRLDDENTGINGAPHIAGQIMQGDSGAFAWAEDGNLYFLNGTYGVGAPLTFNGATAWMSYQTADLYHTVFTNINTAFQNGVTNMNFNSYDPQWFGFPTISVKGSMYNWLMDTGIFGRISMMKSTDHYASTLAPNHNVGPTTTSITNMTCSSGSITATSLLNITDLIPMICDGGLHGGRNCSISYVNGLGQSVTSTNGSGVGIIVAGVTGGTNANGVFGPVTSATANTITWTQTALAGSCAGWNGGSAVTGVGGTINVYGWDLPTAPAPGGGVAGVWIQREGRDYTGTNVAGMDSYVYFWAPVSTGDILCRIRIENLPVQRTNWGCYTGKQNGDDGLYSANWDYSVSKTSNATVLNLSSISFRQFGRGGLSPQEVYIPTFNRFLISYELTSVTDSWGGGVAIIDGGQYHWSPITQIGSAQRNVDLYPSSTPQFPQFDARTATQVDANTVSIALTNGGGNFGKSITPANSMTASITRDIILTPRAAAVPTLLPAGLAGQEVTSGLDLAYDFDVPTGSSSMPNKAPSDAKQAWAWSGANIYSRLWTDRYGSFNFTSAASSLSNGNGTVPTGDFHSNIVAFAANESSLTTPLMTTPYAQTLGASTTLYCFGNYPSALIFASSQGAGAIALQKSGDLSISKTASSLTGWDVTFKATSLGSVSIAAGSIGCLVVRRDSSNRVTVYNSNAIGSGLPLTPVLGPTTVSGTWSSSPLVMGDATNSFWGIVSLLRVWSRDLGDDELIGEMAVVRAKLRSRGAGSNIP